MPNIYLTENLHNKTLGICPWRYIGSDYNDNPEYFGSNKKLKEDIAKLGKNCFKKNILVQYEEIDSKELRRIEAKKFLQPNDVKHDHTYYNESNLYAPGGGKKGMKHRVARSPEHIEKIIQHRTGSIKNESARQLMRKKKLGSKAKESTKYLMSQQRAGALNTNALSWTIISPKGEVHNVIALRAWARENKHSFYEIYNSRNGWIATRHGKGLGGGRKKKVNKQHE